MVERSTNPFDLEAKVAIVTGGASGIGAGIAAVLAEAGAIVVIADRDEAGAQRVGRDLEGAAGAPKPYTLISLTKCRSYTRARRRYPTTAHLGCWSTMRAYRIASCCCRAGGRMGPHEHDQCAGSLPDDARDRAGHGGGRPRRADRQHRVGRLGGIAHQRLGGLFRFQGRSPRLEPRERVRAHRLRDHGQYGLTGRRRDSWGHRRQGSCGGGAGAPAAAARHAASRATSAPPSCFSPRPRLATSPIRC